MQRIDQNLVASEPIAQLAAQKDRVDWAVGLVERDVGPGAMVLVAIDSVNRLVQAAAKCDVQLLKATANGEEWLLALDCGPDERKGESVAQRIEPVRVDPNLLAVMLGRDVRAATRQEDRIGNLEKTADIRHAGADWGEQRLTIGDLSNRRSVFAADGIEHVTFD
jgi:hypothetical protein